MRRVCDQKPGFSSGSGTAFKSKSKPGICSELFSLLLLHLILLNAVNSSGTLHLDRLHQSRPTLRHLTGVSVTPLIEVSDRHVYPPENREELLHLLLLLSPPPPSVEASSSSLIRRRLRPHASSSSSLPPLPSCFSRVD
ncbi:hypothetical protein HYC85_021360 [Camellia sinensis]|uniref:Uncharacterized protein n=1 Tax=Camellia sinensis TaxID=4442 RepID=A0A7J7GHG6_CAMSI|nr:hypothetical protein HYC85_021360 [Camellia sinensis]